MGITEANQDQFLTPEDFANVPADEAWVYACVSRLYTAAQDVPLRVYVRDGVDLIPAATAGDEPGLACQYLLDNVNPIDMNGSDLKAYTMASWAVWGGSYWQKVRGTLAGRAARGTPLAWPKELYWLRVPDVRPYAPDGRQVLRYDYQPRSGLKGYMQIDPADMVPFRSVNLSDPLKMLSPLSPIRNEIAVNKNAAIHTKTELDNGGIPPMAIVPEKGVEVLNEDRRLVSRIMRAMRGPQNAGKMPVMPAGFDFKELALHSADAQWIEARQISRLAICAALHVPPIIAGDDTKTNVYGNIRDARRVFWLDGVIPKLGWIADTVNNFVTSEFDPSRSRLVAAFDLSEVEALQDPWPQQVTSWIQAVQAQVLVPDEMRAHIFHLGPRPDGFGARTVPPSRITLKGDVVPGSVPGTYPDPDNPVPTAPLVYELSGEPEPSTPDTGSVERSAAALRGFGRNLYTHPTVRAWCAVASDPVKRYTAPLDVRGLLGAELPAPYRAALEDGVRARKSADQIAALLEAISQEIAP